MDNAENDLAWLWDEPDGESAAFSARATWFRDSVQIQILFWAVTSLFLYCADLSWAKWTGLANFVVSFLPEDELLFGWSCGTLVNICCWRGILQAVFTSEAKAMVFKPWSILVFTCLLAPAPGRVLCFDGWDGRTYVRRIRAVNFADRSNSWPHVQTRGDVTDAPEDRLLYSANGADEWLDSCHIRGMLLAGPFSIKVCIFIFALCLLASPPATITFLITSQNYKATILYLIWSFLRCVVIAFLQAAC